MKPTDTEILRAMLDQYGGHKCVTYVIRNRLGRTRCSTDWLRARLKIMQKEGLVDLSPRQDRGGMIQWDVTSDGRAVLS